MMDARSAALDFVRRQHDGARAAFLGGSAPTAAVTSASDLDIFIVVDESDEIAYVETSRHGGWLVEAFVYSPSGAETWMQRDRANRRPVLDSIVAAGIPLTDNDETRTWAQRSRELLAAGPRSADPTELDARRYRLSALVDDLAGCTDRSEEFAIAASAFQEAAELTLLVHRCWLGEGKWLIKNLSSIPDHGLVAWAGGDRHPTDLRRICRAVLDTAGGYLQDGFLRGVRPDRP